MSEVSNIRVHGANTAEVVGVVHEALLALAEALALDALETDDLDTAVIEAANNVVHHAYDGAGGPLEVELYSLDAAVEVAVRDRGLGIRPHLGERRGPHTGIGLPIIHSLTERVCFSNRSGGGTEVRMRFAAPRAAALEDTGTGPWQPSTVAAGEAAGTIELELGPRPLARAVLPGVLGSLAAAAGFSAAGIAELRLLGDALANGGAGRLRILLSASEGALELRAEPLHPDARSALLSAAVAQGGLRRERLSEREDSSAEVLALRLHDGA